MFGINFFKELAAVAATLTQAVFSGCRNIDFETVIFALFVR